MTQEKSGFTLIELLVVISIIGLLTSIVLVNLSSVKARARDARRISEIRSIYPLLELYWLDYNYYPPCQDYGPGTRGPGSCDAIPEAGTRADTSRPWIFLGDDDFMSFLNPYLPSGEIPVDPINNAEYYYVYNTGEYPPSSNVFWDFCILAKLEDLNNPALSLDTDICYPL